MRYLELVLFGVYTDLRTEVARRFLGFLWWVREPVMYMLVFYVVFGVGMRQGGPDYVPFLLCGMVPWKWFDGSVRQASVSIVGNSGLIQQIHVPKVVFGLVQIFTNTFKFLIVFLLLVGFLVLTPGVGALELASIALLATVVVLHVLEKTDHEHNDGLYATVVLPEFIPAHRWQYLLHNQTAWLLKLALIYQRRRYRHPRVFVDVPFYLRD